MRSSACCILVADCAAIKAYANQPNIDCKLEETIHGQDCTEAWTVWLTGYLPASCYLCTTALFPL
jgi:hypothetical protein